MKSILTVVLVLLLILPVVTCSQTDEPAKIQIGASTGIILPLGKFKDANTGFNFSPIVSVPLSSGYIDLRMSMSIIDNSNKTTLPSYSHFGFEVYRELPISKSLLWHFGGGAFFQTGKVDVVTSSYIVTVSENKFGLSAIIGIGAELMNNDNFVCQAMLDYSIGIEGFDYTNFKPNFGFKWRL